MARWLVSDGTVAKQANANVRVAVNGVVQDVIRACVAENGIVREFYPTAVAPVPVTPEILWTTDAFTVTQEVADPADSIASIIFTRSLGAYSYLNHPNANGVGQFLSPALDGTAGDDDKFLIKVDQVSGTALTGTLAAWIDLNSLATQTWSLDETIVGNLTALANISIAQDDGLGSPAAGTTVGKAVTFNSTVVAAGTEIVWSTLEQSLYEYKEAEAADCDLIFNPAGWANGDADTSGSFTENWHVNSPNLALPIMIDRFDAPIADRDDDLTEARASTSGDFTVNATLVSGTAPTGSALGVDLTLDVLRQWTLTANANEDLSCELDVTVSDGVTPVTKRVNMHSEYVQATDDNVWTTATWSLGDAIPYAATGVRLEINNDGTAQGFVLLDGTPYEDEDWHDDAPAPADPENYEVFVHQTGGPDVGSDTYGGTFESWVSLASSGQWQVNAANMGTLTQHFWEVSVRKVGQASVTKTVRIFLGIDI